MQKTIITLIPQYGELNRICKDWIVSHTFSFEKQKFIVDFYSEWSDIKAFEQAILELVLHTPPEPCTLLLKSLKKEVREYTRLYESYRLPHDEVIMRVCNQYADSYKEAIKEEMEVVNRLRKPMNEANNRYDSIGYREHTPEEEKLAEREYERCKAEYEKEKAQLDHLYDQQTLLWKEARQYMETVAVTFTCLAYTSWASWPNMYRTKKANRTKQTGRAVQTASRKLKLQPHRLQLRLPDCLNISA